ncbi:MAG: Methylthioribose-1-phosphate isomerase [Firmicutes bacterium ADurb.Bin248]|nr:MAG: Methylthioribose-1-phosphate isomerase [Firmicutes bacterium ADurb.Bin248]
MDNIRLTENDGLWILDQTLLPGEEKESRLQSAEDMYEAIASLRVRGAPAIGIFAAYCMYLLAKGIAEAAPQTFHDKLAKYGAYLNSSRPTAVNLNWAIEKMLGAAKDNLDKPRDELLATLRREAVGIHGDDIAKCRTISEYGLTLIQDGDGILTHCNAGPLATSKYGTALGPILLGAERGMRFHVYADETRPLLQGARLTAYELARAGIPATLICDNMASIVMRNGWVRACFVGCDRVAANGDVANKIGTSGVAILAKHYGVPFYVLGPTSTIDMGCATGADIEIELRDPEEIRSKFYAKPMAPAGVKCYNPAFDVTDHALITAIVTEKGICREPYGERIRYNKFRTIEQAATKREDMAALAW